MKLRVLGFVAAAALTTTSAARQASALDLAAVGKSFASDLAGEAAKCKSRLTGLNLGSVKAVFGCLVDAVKLVGKKGLINVLQALFAEGIALLKDNAPQAKAKLQALAGKVTAVVPAAKSFIDPVINGIVDAGGTALVAQAANCKSKLNDLTLNAAKATFACLGEALKTAGKAAGIAVVQGLFDAFVAKLRQGCGPATAALASFAAKLKVIPGAAKVIDTVIGYVKNGCDGAVDKLASVKLPN